MAQHDYVISDQNGLSFLADLNAALAAIKTTNSGTEPPNPSPYMPWSDTAADIFKLRNAANDAWVPILSLSTGLPVNLGVGSVVQPYDADTAKLDVEQTWSQVQRTSEAIGTSLTLDLDNAALDFRCTPSAGGRRPARL